MIKLSRFIFLLFFIIISTISLNSKLSASNPIADRDFQRGNFQHGDFNHQNFNHSNFNHNMPDRNNYNHAYGAYGAGAAHGASQGAAYGAAYGSAASSAPAGIPINPNAAEQNMLYYGGVHNMEQQ